MSPRLSLTWLCGFILFRMSRMGTRSQERKGRKDQWSGNGWPRSTALPFSCQLGKSASWWHNLWAGLEGDPCVGTLWRPGGRRAQEERESCMAGIASWFHLACSRQGCMGPTRVARPTHISAALHFPNQPSGQPSREICTPFSKN